MACLELLTGVGLLVFAFGLIVSKIRAGNGRWALYRPAWAAGLLDLYLSNLAVAANVTEYC